MGRYTVIYANKEQAKALYDKHMTPKMKPSGLFGFISKLRPSIISMSFSYDNEDSIGFVGLKTITGKSIAYQLRNGEPMFIEFTGFDNIRYDISYPKELNEEMYLMLKEYGNQASNNFWKGGEI
jgi:hypothetical protein